MSNGAISPCEVAPESRLLSNCWQLTFARPTCASRVRIVCAGLPMSLCGTASMQGKERKERETWCYIHTCLRCLWLNQFMYPCYCMYLVNVQYAAPCGPVRIPTRNNQVLKDLVQVPNTGDTVTMLPRDAVSAALSIYLSRYTGKAERETRRQSNGSRGILPSRGK